MRHINPTREDPMDSLIRLALADGCVEKETAVFDSLDVSHVVFDSHYLKQRARIIRRGNRTPASYTVRHTWIRVALLALFIISMGTMAVIGVSGMIENWREYVEWYERSFSVSYDVPETTDTAEIPEDSKDTSEMIPPTLIEEYRKPTYVPEFFEENILDSKVFYMVDYYMDGKYICGFTQGTFDASEIKFGSDGAHIYDSKVHQYNAIWMEYDDGMIGLVWNDGEYIYTLLCYDKQMKNEILKMAESVQ